MTTLEKLSNSEIISLSRDHQLEPLIQDNAIQDNEILDLTNPVNGLIEELKSVNPQTLVQKVQSTTIDFLEGTQKGLPPELIRSAQQKVENKTFFSTIWNKLSNLSLASAIKSLVGRVISWVVQSKEAKQEVEAAKFSESISKLRLLGVVAPDEQVTLINRFRLQSTDQNARQNLHATLQKLFNQISQYGRTQLNSRHLNTCLSQNDCMGALNEIYAHALIAEIGKNNNGLILSPKEGQLLLDVQKVLQNGLSLKQYADELEAVTLRNSAYGWIKKFPTLFANSCPNMDALTLMGSVQNNEPSIVRSELKKILTPISVLSEDKHTKEVILAKEILACLTLYKDDELISTIGLQSIQEKFSNQWRNKLTQLNDTITATKVQKETLPLLEELSKKAEALLTCKKIARIVPSIIAQPLSAVRTLQRNITALAPGSSKLADKINVLGVYFSCGHGHKSCMNNLKEYLTSSKDKSFTVQTSDFIRDIAPDIDPVTKIFGNLFVDDNKQPFATDSLFNHFMNKDQIKVLKWLDKLAGAPASKETLEIQYARIREKLLQEAPDMLVVPFTRYLGPLLHVAEQLGIPLIHVSTDRDYKLNECDVRPYKYFKNAVPDLNPISRETLQIGSQINKDQVEEIGLSVKMKFESDLTLQEIKDMRQELNVQQGEKVVVISNGGGGLKNKIPEYLAKNYKDDQNPIRLVVLAGRNEAFKKELDEKIVPTLLTNPAVKMTVLGFTDKIPQIFKLPETRVLIGKGGGITTYEAEKSTLPMIVDETTDGRFSDRMDWERVNAKVLISKKMAVKITTIDQTVQALTQLLAMPRPEISKTAKISASTKFVDLTKNLVNLSKNDENFTSRIKKWN